MLVILVAFFIYQGGLATSPAFAYDNSTFPDFVSSEESRQFAWLSIHPDDERWLITECTDRIDKGLNRCFLFIYNIKTQAYQRFDLPGAYSYSQGQFSPTGKQILATRIPLPKDDSHQEATRVAGEAQILLMSVDGEQLRTIEVPNARLRAPTMSPDGAKIAYWSAAKIRPEGSKTFMTDFDLYEHDLRNGTNQLFSGQFHFFLVGRFQYKNQNQIVADADGILDPTKTGLSYSERFKFSSVYCFDRSVTAVQDPCLVEVPHARNPSLDAAGNLYLGGQHDKYGISLFRISTGGQVKSWRTPKFSYTGISFQTASSSGRYLGFIYSSAHSSRGRYRNALGHFDFSSERWIPMSLPAPESAEILRTAY